MIAAKVANALRAGLAARAARGDRRRRRRRRRDGRARPRGRRRPRARAPARRQDPRPGRRRAGGARRGRRVLATPTRCGSRTRCASSSSRSPTRRSATSAARSTFTNEAGTNQEGLYWRYEMWLRAQESRWRRSPAATARSTPCAARPTSRSTRSWATTSRSRSGWSRTAGAPSTSPSARASEKMVPSIEGEWARKRRMMSHGWPIVVKGGLADPRGYSPLYALMIVSHRLLRYGTPFLHVLARARDARAAAPRRASTRLAARRAGRAARPPRSPACRRAPAAGRPLLRAHDRRARRRPVRLAAPRHAGRLGRAGGHAVRSRLPALAPQARARRRAVRRRAARRQRAGRRARRASRSGWSPTATRSTASAASARTGTRFEVYQAAHDGLRRRAHGRGDGGRRGRRPHHPRRRAPAPDVDRRAAEPGQRAARARCRWSGRARRCRSRSTPTPTASAGGSTVRPGLTGWAQVNGRASLPWPERIELDLWYLEHASLRLDLRILVLSARMAITGHGLYRGETGGWR